MQDKSARTLRANNAGHPRGAATPGLSAGGWRGVLEGLRVGSEGNWTRRAREAGDGEARGAAARGRRLGGGRGHWRTSGRSSAPVSRAGAAGHVRPLRESRELEEGLCAAGLEAPVLESGVCPARGRKARGALWCPGG